VYLQGHGIVLDEPSVVAIDVRDGRPLAVGIEAKAMIGRTPPHIRSVARVPPVMSPSVMSTKTGRTLGGTMASWTAIAAAGCSTSTA
jgi:actin-like ATPase involved in cell morphogenesis